jgi:hypothetical protein
MLLGAILGVRREVWARRGTGERGLGEEGTGEWVRDGEVAVRRNL